MPTLQTHRAAAFLFDMDGVLMDSTAAVLGHWREFARWQGIEEEALLADVHGRRAVDVIERWRGSLRTTTEEAIRQFEAMDVAGDEGILAMPGAVETLAALPADRWALVTSATRAAARTRLSAAGLPLPRTIVAADDVTHGKPHPTPYLAAARELGVSPSECLVVEDAPNGVRAGKDAGCRVLALLTTHPAQELGAADLIAPDLTAVRLRAVPAAAEG